MDFKEGVGAMIEKYFNGVIEQVYHRIGNAEKNIVMASYNNDFSVSGLENKKRYQEDDNVFLPVVNCDMRHCPGHMRLFWILSVTCSANL